MARRNDGILELLLDVTSKLPWYIGVLMAGFFYLALHYYAISPVEVSGETPKMMSVMLSNILRTIASFLQYLVPLACVIGAATSWYRRRKSRALYENVTSNQVSLDQLSWKEFETLMAAAFRHRGYLVIENYDLGPDGGVDLVLKKGEQRIFVQCKHWKARSVPVQVVRELGGVVAANNASAGIVVSSGRFTREAESFAHQSSIELIGRNELLSMLGHAKGSLENPVSKTSTSPSPVCPKCQSEMVLRTARRGDQAGNQFWGCSRFPKCRGILNI